MPYKVAGDPDTIEAAIGVNPVGRASIAYSQSERPAHRSREIRHKARMKAACQITYESVFGMRSNEAGVTNEPTLNGAAHGGVNSVLYLCCCS